MTNKIPQKTTSRCVITKVGESHGSFPKEVHNHPTTVRRLPMLPNVDALPGAEDKFAARDWDAQVDSRERSADVRGHVIVAFRRVDEHRVAIGHEMIEKRVKVAAHVRIGILLNDERSRRVLQMERGEARLETAFGDELFNPAGELVEAASAGWNLQFVNALTQHDHKRAAR